MNEVGDCFVGEVTFEVVPAFDLTAPALEFHLHEGTQTTEEMVAHGPFPAHEELFRSTDLLARTMVAFDAPVLAMDIPEGAKGNFPALFFRGSYCA